MTTSALRAHQFSPQSSLAVLENIDHQIDQSGWIIYGIAAAILITAAIGISNTLFMSIVERTPEFGIMKSIGARDSHILWLMIIEGAILGIVGAATAILLSLLLGIAGQSLLKMYVESRDSDPTCWQPVSVPDPASRCDPGDSRHAVCHRQPASRLASRST